jgi:hypothetical protein
MLCEADSVTIEYVLWLKFQSQLRVTQQPASFKLQLVPRNFSRGRGVIPSLAGLGEQSCQRSYYQFGM